VKTEAPFQLDFVLDQKAAITEADDGSIFIEGFASDFGLDRQNEAFEDGAFDKGMKSFMDSNPVLLYHHHYDQALGRVVEYAHKAAGMWIKAKVDQAESGTPLADVVRKIKSGTIRGFSVGGKFHRRQTPKGPRIHTADVMEISVTPFPINPRTIFEVAGKAFADEAPELDALASRLEKLTVDFSDIEATLDEKAASSSSDT
jgi:HK97 family phage prohead protease